MALSQVMGMFPMVTLYRRKNLFLALHGNDSRGIHSQSPWERFPQLLCLKIQYEILSYVVTTAVQQLLLADQKHVDPEWETFLQSSGIVPKSQGVH